MHWFYNPAFTILSPDLTKEDWHHAKRVLRMAHGDNMQITNGKGLVATCVYGDTLQVLHHEQLPAPTKQIHLAIAPTKSNERTEWLIEKAVEVGISEITFILTHHSERRKINLDRYIRVATAAVKQSRKAWFPVVNDLTSIQDFVHRASASTKCIAYCGEATKIPLTEMNNHDTLILVGPEGDFSPAEVEMAISQGFQPTTLGETRLRTETAAFVAVTLLNYH